MRAPRRCDTMVSTDISVRSCVVGVARGGTADCESECGAKCDIAKYKRDPRRKKLDSRKETETRLKLVGHNIRRVRYLEVMGDVVSHWRGGI